MKADIYSIGDVYYFILTFILMEIKGRGMDNRGV